ncbi:AEC family transporter [Radiobacillus sp. PE A8.2]|uniref:AEC family transporter n=1 Tax=Radiobacillus sp. PE A8.2 TaxID=3380349 RepID=UPI00388D32FA
MNVLTVLIPIFGVFAIGYIGFKLLKFEIKSISTMALYLMSPFLAFRTFYENEINIDYFYLGASLLLLCGLSIFICYVIGAIGKWNKQERSSFILASSFMNNGNYGTPLVLLVFGEAGFHYAVILMVLQQLIMCTIGIYIAAYGGASNARGQKHSPLKEVLMMPIVYGALLGVVFNLANFNIGAQLMTAVSMVADAAIPTIMIVLGMQLATIKLKKLEKGRLSLALLLRLVGGPIIAYLITVPLPLDDMIRNIIILMAAMPTAANTTMYALQFDTKPDFVSSATLTSTLLSVVTIPIILALLL